MGRRSQLYQLPLAYQWTRRSIAVVVLLGATGGWNPHQDSTVLAVYECGKVVDLFTMNPSNNGGRLPRSDITKV
jgi:hypothetical protein